MKNTYSYILPAFALFLSSLPLQAANPYSEADLKEEAISIVKTFSGELKPKLKGAIQTGGLEHAVKVCSIEAPAIASSLSSETGWMVKRVSLKPRNKNSALPDSFETMVLEKFNEIQAKGESPALLEYSEIVDNQYRFMKAQAVEGICLSCHGSSISPDTKRIIDEHYPDDLATAYSLGEIRGAFSLVKDL